jgi:Tfp pilus assembly protein PilX
MNARSKHQRGFSLFVVVVLTAAITVTSLFTLDVLGLNLTLQANERQARDALQAAEGGMQEMLHNQRFLDLLPDGTSEGAAVEFTPSEDSLFGIADNSDIRTQYRGEIQLIRITPLAESSHSLTRGIVYKVTIEAEQGFDASSTMEGYVYKIVASQRGAVTDEYPLTQ